MPVVIQPPTEARIPLNLPSDIDPDNVTYVVVRPATVNEQDRRAQIFGEVSRTYHEGDKAVEIKTDWTLEDQRRIEVFVTLADCNLERIDPLDKTKTIPLFKFQPDNFGKRKVAMTESEFNAAWGLLPEVIAAAIHKAVLQVNPQWSYLRD